MAWIADSSSSPQGSRRTRRKEGPRPVRFAEALAAIVGSPAGRWLRRAWSPVLVLLSGGVILALVLLDAPAMVRAVPVLAYIAVVPGLACVRLVRLPDRFLGLLLGVGLSLALGTLVAQAMVYLHQWSPMRGLSTLVVIASLAACVELFQSRLTPRLRRPARRRAS